LITSTEEVRPLFEQNFSRYFTEAADYLGWKNIINRTIDCANGVGAKAMPNFNNLIKNYITAELNNTSDDEFLNKDCGADHVKTKKLFPRNFQRQPHDSYLSFDGDADRIVF
jgi:phosphomannomutase